MPTRGGTSRRRTGVHLAGGRRSLEAWWRTQPSKSLYRCHQWHGDWTISGLLRDSRIPWRTGDRGGHRDRPVVGGLSRLGFVPFSVRLLVHTGFLVARRSDCDVRNVLSRAAPTDPAGSRSHRPDHAPRWCRNPTEIGGGETKAK